MARRPKRKPAEQDIASKHFSQAIAIVRDHPMFAPLWQRANVYRDQQWLCPADGWAVVASNGSIHVHQTRRGQPEEWVYVLAHCLLHLGFGHFRKHGNPRAWNSACDCFVARFLADLKLGRPPEELRGYPEFSARDEESLYRQFDEQGTPEHLVGFGTAVQQPDLFFTDQPEMYAYLRGKTDWPNLLSAGIAQAVTQAVQVASGQIPELGSTELLKSPAQQARSWFISSYPLLGALAEAFKIIEDPRLCQRLGISVAAVDIEGKEIYVNPAAALDEQEARFVLAHELLHVGLRHDVRRQGRDAYLWNVACDYVINGWLVEMGIGDIPQFGGLHDEQLKGLSAESVYDRIVTDLPRYRKLATLAGFGQCDMLPPRVRDWWSAGNGLLLDEFYRQCLTQGLDWWEQQGRGFLPLGLVEEIRALNQPPIPWDVELAQWFDGYFAPIEKRRTYARPSRRQSATPDIPRPHWVPIEGAEDGRTFGVVLDTSGSMDRTMLAKALGAMASYAISREVPAVRVVFCDAAVYDQGYLLPEQIAERVKIKGRGGTVIQPAIDLLEKAEDFPKTGPLLIITDGLCDRLHIHRPHAFLMPRGAGLPFVPKGRVFRMT